MYNPSKKTTLINAPVINGTDIKIPLNFREIFEKITNPVLYREIVPEINQRAIKYQQWFFDEQKKVEQILSDCGYMLSGIGTQINLLPDDFLVLLKITNENSGNDENEECYANNSMAEQKSNSSRCCKMNLSPSNNDHNDRSLLSTMVAKGIRNFCVKRTANAICKKKEIMKAAVEKTRKFREDSQSRVKRHKKQIDKENEERRKQSLTKIKKQALKAAANRDCKRHHKTSGAPVVKRARNIHNSTSTSKRTCSKAKENDEIAPKHIMQQQRGRIKIMKKAAKKEAFYDDTMNHSAFLGNANANQIACTKSDLETAVLSKFETAISEESNMEATQSSKPDSNVSKMEDSLQIITALPNSDMDMEQNHTDIELVDVPKSRHTSHLFTSKNSSKQNDDANIYQVDNSLSTSLISVNTASILERTRPVEKNTDITERSTYVFHRGEMRKIDSNNMINEGITKRSTYLNRDLKSERNISDDDLRIMSMDLRSSSSCQSKVIRVTNDDVVKIKDVEEKHGKVTGTRFPGRKTLEELEERELTRINHSTDTKQRIEKEDGDHELYDLSSNDRTDSNEKQCKKIPSWAKEENVRHFLEKQQIWSLSNIDALFGKIHPPDMQKMFGDAIKLRSATRTSSSMWESPIWNPRVGYSAYHRTIQQTEEQQCNIRRSQRVKKPVSYLSYF
ncbi:Inner centromere protein ARK binding region family protein [Acanthocheilonema viteae]